MRTICLVLAGIWLAMASACTSLQPTEATPGEIERMIVTDGVLQAGQRVRLVTADGVEHEFRVRNVDLERRLVLGNEESVPFADIVALETRKVSAGRTALLTGGILGIGFVIAIAIAPAMILAGG